MIWHFHYNFAEIPRKFIISKRADPILCVRRVHIKSSVLSRNFFEILRNWSNLRGVSFETLHVCKLINLRGASTNIDIHREKVQRSY